MLTELAAFTQIDAWLIITSARTESVSTGGLGRLHARSLCDAFVSVLPNNASSGGNLAIPDSLSLSDNARCLATPCGGFDASTGTPTHSDLTTIGVLFVA